MDLEFETRPEGRAAREPVIIPPVGKEGSLRIVPTPKRVRAIVGGETIADSLRTLLLLEGEYSATYYFPREDVRRDLLRESERRTHCPLKGDASYWHARRSARWVEDAAWSYEDPIAGAEAIKGHIAFYWEKVDGWLEEDEEVFGHPHHPYHLIDIRRSNREVTVEFGGETVARTTRTLFLFETGLPARYYIPPQDVRTDLLERSETQTICAYKGFASYWSLRSGGRVAEDAVWAYEDPLPEYPRIKGYFCFYPEKVDLLRIEGE
jgi:uncharacterized protein (DUF427 family)